LHWIRNKPAFGKQAVYLDGRYSSGINSKDSASFRPSVQELMDMGVGYIAPPVRMLVTVEGRKIVLST